jgi:hypothetical protein
LGMPHLRDLTLHTKTKRIGIQKYAWTSKILFCPEIATNGGDHNREMRTVRKTQHQNPEFGPKPGEIRKNQQKKKYISIQERRARNSNFLVVNWVSSCIDPSFLCPERLHCCYIYFHYYYSRILCIKC